MYTKLPTTKLNTNRGKLRGEQEYLWARDRDKTGQDVNIGTYVDYIYGIYTYTT